MYLSESYVLAVGIGGLCRGLGDLPVEICAVETGFAALQQFRRRVPSVLVALWDLPDMPDGMLFRRVLAAAGSVATVAMIEFDNPGQEVAARTLGVTVVLDDDTDEQMIRELLGQLSATMMATGT